MIEADIAKVKNFLMRMQSIDLYNPDYLNAANTDLVSLIDNIRPDRKEYVSKLHQLIESLYEEETPHPELIHHKMVVDAKKRLLEVSNDRSVWAIRKLKNETEP